MPRGHSTSSKPAGQNLPRAQGKPGPDEPVAGMTTCAQRAKDRVRKRHCEFNHRCCGKGFCGNTESRDNETFQSEKSLFVLFACLLALLFRKCVLGHTVRHNLPLKTPLRVPTHLFCLFRKPVFAEKIKLETNRGLNKELKALWPFYLCQLLLP